MQRFGEMVVQQGWITPIQLNEALFLQKNGSLKLGELMLQQGLLQPFHVDLALTVQRTSPTVQPLGSIIRELGFLQRRQIEQAAQYQQAGKQLLGEIMVELGYITPEQRDQVSNTLSISNE